MSPDSTPPLETDWTVDDVTILPGGRRYELIDGHLDLWDAIGWRGWSASP